MYSGLPFLKMINHVFLHSQNQIRILPVLLPLSY